MLAGFRIYICSSNVIELGAGTDRVSRTRQNIPSLFSFSGRIVVDFFTLAMERLLAMNCALTGLLEVCTAFSK